MQKAIEQNAQNDRLCLLINLTPHQPGWSRSSKCFNFFFCCENNPCIKKRKGHIWRWSSCTWWCARLCGFLTKIDFWSQIQFCKFFWNCQFVVEFEKTKFLVFWIVANVLPVTGRGWGVMKMSNSRLHFFHMWLGSSCLLLVHYCPDNPTINIVTFRRLPTSLLNYSMSSLIQKCNNQYRWQHQTAQNCVFEGTKQLLNKGKFFKISRNWTLNGIFSLK